MLTLADLVVPFQPRMSLNNRVQNRRNCCAGKLARLQVFNSKNVVGWCCAEDIEGSTPSTFFLSSLVFL